MIRKTLIALAVLSLAPVQPSAFQPDTECASASGEVLASTAPSRRPSTKTSWEFEPALPKRTEPAPPAAPIEQIASGAATVHSDDF